MPSQQTQHLLTVSSLSRQSSPKLTCSVAGSPSLRKIMQRFVCEERRARRRIRPWMHQPLVLRNPTQSTMQLRAGPLASRLRELPCNQGAHGRRDKLAWLQKRWAWAWIGREWTVGWTDEARLRPTLQGSGGSRFSRGLGEFSRGLLRPFRLPFRSIMELWNVDKLRASLETVRDCFRMRYRLLLA